MLFNKLNVKLLQVLLWDNTVPDMTYKVFGGRLNLALSIYLWHYILHLDSHTHTHTHKGRRTNKCVAHATHIMQASMR